MITNYQSKNMVLECEIQKSKIAYHDVSEKFEKLKLEHDKLKASKIESDIHNALKLPTT